MFAKRSWIIIVLVLCWKVALLVFTSQPVQAGEGFFFDGAAAHKLAQGGFFNPPISHAFPILGARLFGACPPLYEIVLIPWIYVFGTSVLSVMWLHLLFFAAYMAILWRILERLKTPAWCINLAACLLLAIPANEGPESLAHCFGMIGIYACIRTFRVLDQSAYENAKVWGWIMAVCPVLAFCTSLEAGVVYSAVIFFTSIVAWFAGRVRPPVLPLLLMLALPVGLVYLAKTMLPGFWDGFEEYVHAIPFCSEIQRPHWHDIFEMLRAVPGILLVTALLPLGLMRKRINFSSFHGKRFWLLLLPGLIAAIALSVAGLLSVNSHATGIASYFQCLIVGCYLGYCGTFSIQGDWLKRQTYLFVPVIGLGALTIMGMSTWGVACALDVGRADAMSMIDQEIGGSHPEDYKVVISGAYLYDLVAHEDMEMIHPDWIAPMVNGARAGDFAALLALKPQKFILTQHDFFLHYYAMLEVLQGRPEVRKITVVNKAIRRTPDSVRYVQKVVRDVSWAPVMVDISWKSAE